MGYITNDMANGIVFITRPGKKAEVPIYIRVRFERKDYMVKIPEVTTTLDTWPNGQNAQVQIRLFYPVLGKIHDAISRCLKRGDFSKDKLDEIIYSIVREDSESSISLAVHEWHIGQQGHPVSKSKRILRSSKKSEIIELSFIDYFEQFVKEFESGKRKTIKGVVASARTITNYKQGLNRMKEFQNSMHMHITWEGINRDFINEFIQFIQSPKRGDNRYNTNTVAKRIKEIKHLVRAAREDGVTDIPVPEYKFGEVAVDSIYLTKDEISRFSKADLTGLTGSYEIARDLFLVGVYAGQRVSDYNSVSADQIVTDEDGRMYITFYQKKTHKEVTVPVRKPLREILAKYNNNLPALSEPTINLCIKEIGKRAKINDIIEYTSTKGGVEHIVKAPKYKLITTHTARRTFATLAYLDGMDSMDIRRVTGHSSERILSKYIKSTAHDTARMMARKSHYWD